MDQQTDTDIHRYRHIQTDKQTDRQTDRQMSGDRQTANVKLTYTLQTVLTNCYSIAVNG